MTDLRIKCPYDPLCKMMPIMGKEQEHNRMFHMPEPDNGIQYWSDHFQQLGHAPKKKAQKLIDLQRIKYTGGCTYVALPIEGYNTRVHVMRKDETGSFRCSCQGFSKNGTCSHIGALFLFFSMHQRYPEKSRDASA